MKWYLKVFRQYADFSGRARRKEFWMFVLFNFIAVIAVMIADNVFGLTLKGMAVTINVFGLTIGMAYGALYCMYMAALWPPALALVVRRLHDTGKSGWWIWINLIPLAGSVWYLVLLFTDGQPGANPYGANPKEHDGFDAKRKTRSAAVALIFVVGLLFIGFLNSAISFGLKYNMYVWIDILYDIIPIATLLVAGIALLRKKDRTAVAAIALLIASGLLFLLSVYSIYEIISMAEMWQEQGRYLIHLLFRLAWFIVPVTLGIAGLALLLPRVKLKIPLLIASGFYLLVYVFQGIDTATVMHGWDLDLDNMLSEFAKFFINNLTIVTPFAMLALAYMLPGRKGAEEADETPTEDHHKEIKTYSNPDRATHINMATNDLCAMCGTAALGGNIDENREWIRYVGQDLYDTHGFSAMQEVFINVKNRYPMFQAKLSAMWDGVGGWAD